MICHSRLGVCAALVLTVLVALPEQAQAFVQTQTCTRHAGPYMCRSGEVPKDVHWNRLEVGYHVHEAGTSDIPNGPDGRIGQELLEAIQESFETWNAPVCSNFRLTFRGITDRDEIGYDDVLGQSNINLVVWRDDDWPYSGSSALALTTVTYRPSSGVIVDADIELNGAFFTFTNTDNPSQAHVDIKNTLTHEVGHFLGLDHSGVQDATMFATAPEGEFKKRTLHQDDIDGLCHIYPLDMVFPNPIHTEEKDDTCTEGCASTGAGGGPSPTTILLVLAGVGVLLRNRRRAGLTSRRRASL